MRIVKFWRSEENRFKLRVRQREAINALGYLPRSFTPRVQDGAVVIEFYPDESGAYVLWRAGGTIEREFVMSDAPKAPLYLRTWEDRGGRKVLVLRPLEMGDVVRVARTSTGLVVRIPWRYANELGVDPNKPLLAKFEVGERKVTVEFIQLD